MVKLEITKLIVLSRASEAGSPTNRPGSDKTRGQGSFGPSTGGPDLQGSLQPVELTKTPQDFTVSDVEDELKIHVRHLAISKLDNHLDQHFKRNEPHI